MFVVEVSITTIASVLQTLLVDCSEKTVHVFDDGLYFIFSLVYIISLIPFFFLTQYVLVLLHYHVSFKNFFPEQCCLIQQKFIWVILRTHLHLHREGYQ